MKRILLLFGICLLTASAVSEAFGQNKKPRIGIAGIQIENSVFVPNRQPLTEYPVRMPDYLSPDSAMGQAATHPESQLWRNTGVPEGQAKARKHVLCCIAHAETERLHLYRRQRGIPEWFARRTEQHYIP